MDVLNEKHNCKSHSKPTAALAVAINVHDLNGCWNSIEKERERERVGY